MLRLSCILGLPVCTPSRILADAAILAKTCASRIVYLTAALVDSDRETCCDASTRATSVRLIMLSVGAG